MNKDKKIYEAHNAVNIVDHHHAAANLEQRSELNGFGLKAVAAATLLGLGGAQGSSLDDAASNALLGMGAGLAIAARTRRNHDELDARSRTLYYAGVTPPLLNNKGYLERNGMRFIPPKNDAGNWTIITPADTPHEIVADATKATAVANDYLAKEDAAVRRTIKTIALGTILSGGGYMTLTHANANDLTGEALVGLGAGLGAGARRRSREATMAANEQVQKLGIETPLNEGESYVDKKGEGLHFRPPVRKGEDWTIFVTRAEEDKFKAVSRGR